MAKQTDKPLTDDPNAPNLAASLKPVAGTASGSATPAGADPYANPTGFVDFGHYFGANAGAANDQASKLSANATAAADKANADLAQQYAGFQQQVGQGVNRGTASGVYAGPGGFDPNSTALNAATGQINALGSHDANKAQAAMGPHVGWFGAGLVQRAGQPQWDQIHQQYAGLGGAAGRARAQGSAQVDAAKRQTTNNYDAVQGGIAQGQAEAQAAAQRDAQSHSAYDDYVKQITRYTPGEEGAQSRDVPTYEEWLQENGAP